MRSVISQWPLVVFTSIAPLCAGVWIVAAPLVLFDVLPGANMLTTGYAGGALCLLLIGVLACSTLNLGKPAKALRAFARLGNSAVSNEVFMGTLFAVAACLYVLLAPRLIPSGDVWKILLAFVAGCAALFVLFQCLAYRMRTVPTWSSLPFSAEFAVLALLGGAVIAGAVLRMGGTAGFPVLSGLAVTGVLSGVALVLVIYAQGTVVAKSIHQRRDAPALFGQWGAFSFTRVLSVVVGLGLWAFGLLVPNISVTWVLAGTLLVGAGVVAGRLSFYRFYANVGLPQG